jgi:hypothetical protein
MSDTDNGNGNGVPAHLKPYLWTSETAPAQGRAQGSRNKFGLAFIEAIRRQFDEGGEEALRILRIEDPGSFLRVCASVIPHELHLIPAERSVVRWMDEDDEDDGPAAVQHYPGE